MLLLECAWEFSPIISGRRIGLLVKSSHSFGTAPVSNHRSATLHLGKDVLVAKSLIVTWPGLSICFQFL